MAKYTLRDQLVQTGLSAITRNAQKGLFLAGGIAGQMYVQPVTPDLLRPTHDADFSRLPPMDKASFDSLYNGVTTSLSQYTPKRGRDREGYFIKVGENHTPFFFHIERISRKHWERVRHVRERQYSTANEIAIPGTPDKLRIVRPEEFVAEKLRRLHYLVENGILPSDQVPLYDALRKIKFDKPGVIGIDFHSWLADLHQQKDSMSAHYEASPEEGARFRLSYNGQKDLYDAMLMAKLTSEDQIDFDERHFEEILDDPNFILI